MYSPGPSIFPSPCLFARPLSCDAGQARQARVVAPEEEEALCLGEKELDLCQLVSLLRRPKADVWRRRHEVASILVRREGVTGLRTDIGRPQHRMRRAALPRCEGGSSWCPDERPLEFLLRVMVPLRPALVSIKPREARTLARPRKDAELLGSVSGRGAGPGAASEEDRRSRDAPSHSQRRIDISGGVQDLSR